MGQIMRDDIPCLEGVGAHLRDSPMPMFRMAGGIVRTTTAVDGRSYLGGGSRGSPSCCLLSLLHYLVAVILRGVALSNARFCPPVAGCRRPADTRRWQLLAHRSVPRVCVPWTPASECVWCMWCVVSAKADGQQQQACVHSAWVCVSLHATHTQQAALLTSQEARREGGEEGENAKRIPAFGYNTGVIPLLAPPSPLVSSSGSFFTLDFPQLDSTPGPWSTALRETAKVV
jgi:hypothetical protein